MHRKNYAAMAAFAVTFGAGLPALAATVTFAGQTFDNEEALQWRTPGYTKTLDLDGDNVYGSSGYIAFATTPVGGTFVSSYPATPNFAFTMSGAGATASNPAGMTTLASLPGDMTVSDGSLVLNGAAAAGVSAGFYGFIDDPTGTGDLGVGFAVRNTFGNGPTGVAGNVMNFVVGANTPGAGNPLATMRLGLLLVNDTFAVADFTRVQSATSNTGFVENFAGDFGETVMMFDVTDYAAGDVIEVWLQGRSDRVGITGVTFDVVIPEPASTALLLPLLAAGRRRRA
ncbi:MAG: hypothetical protein ACFCVE_02830 [Phycisphaerae bacterium]